MAGGIDRTPVLVGIGVVQQREEDPSAAHEAMALMLEAVRAAGADAGCPALLSQVELISIPKGRWRYRDAGRYLAKAIGSPKATSVLAKVGVLQQTILGDACAQIAEGAIDVALVVGGEASYRQLRGKIAGIETTDVAADGEPDQVLEPSAELVLESEIRSGLGGMPVGYYAIIESAIRAASGRSVEEHRNRIAALYSRFSEVAAGNAHAWRPQRVEAELIKGPSPANPMLAFPYTKLHNSSWNVDQAAALLLCSAGRAAELDIPRSQWVFPQASTESNHMTSLSERPELARCPGARIAGRRALDIGQLEASGLDFVELYSCFPAAVELHAAELGLPADRDWTVTGGMPFAGGPFNNFVLQSTCRMAELLRGRPGSVGLVSSVSGVLTKQGFGLWSTEPGPSPFASVDVTAEVAAATPGHHVDERFDGPARIIGCTVMYEPAAKRAVALVEAANGDRAMAGTTDAGVVDAFETSECCGRSVEVSQGRLEFSRT